MADEKIPKGRVRRSAKLGTALGSQATRYAGTKAANVVRSGEKKDEKLENRHVETALKIAGTLGEMKGAAMKLGQLASFVDTEFIPEEYRELYQEQMSKLRNSAPPMPWEKVEKVLEDEYAPERVHELFDHIEPEAFAAASIGQVHRARMIDGRDVAVKIQYPDVADALEADLRNAGTIVRLAKALAPGLDPKEVAGELKERVMEELDYEFEAQNQRSFARAYRDHPFIYVPQVISRLSRRKVLVTEFVEGVQFDAGQGDGRRGAIALRRDRLPLPHGLDLPPPALQRRRPSRQLHPHARRARRLPRLRDDEEARPRADRAGAGCRRRGRAQGSRTR